MQYDEFRFTDICKARYVFPAPNIVPMKGRTKCGSKSYISAGAFYRKLPFVCIAFLFELVTSSSAYKCLYYQSSVNTLSKVMYSVLFQMACCQTVVRSVLIASSFRFFFVVVLYSVLWNMSLHVGFTILFLLPLSFGSIGWFEPWPPKLCSRPFGLPQQLHFLKCGVVNLTPKPYFRGPGTRLSELPYLSRECSVLRRHVFSVTHLQGG
jgi:hypothetical protein